MDRFPETMIKVFGGVVMVLLALTFLPSMMSTVFDELASGKGDKVDPRSPSADKDESGSPSADVDWSWVTAPATLIAVTAIVVLIALGAVTTCVVRRRSKAAKAKDAEEVRLDRIWSESVERHDRVREAWMEYQSDIDAILAKPALSDLNEPHVVHLVEALGAAADLAGDVRPTLQVTVERYARATRNAESAWRRACAHAERVRLAAFDEGEQDKIRRAEGLLAQARSGAAAPAERRTYYRHAMKLLEGLVRVPEPAREALEVAARVELESPAGTVREGASQAAADGDVSTTVMRFL